MAQSKHCIPVSKARDGSIAGEYWIKARLEPSRAVTSRLHDQHVGLKVHWCAAQRAGVAPPLQPWHQQHPWVLSWACVTSRYLSQVMSTPTNSDEIRGLGMKMIQWTLVMGSRKRGQRKPSLHPRSKSDSWKDCKLWTALLYQVVCYIHTLIQQIIYSEPGTYYMLIKRDASDSPVWR